MYALKEIHICNCGLQKIVSKSVFILQFISFSADNKTRTPKDVIEELSELSTTNNSCNTTFQWKSCL